MTRETLDTIIDTLETRYKARSYENEYERIFLDGNEYERIFLDGQKAAIADVRYYVKLMEDKK